MELVPGDPHDFSKCTESTAKKTPVITWMRGKSLNKLYTMPDSGIHWLVVSTHLKNMLVKLDHFPRDRGKKKMMKPPTRFTIETPEKPTAGRPIMMGLGVSWNFLAKFYGNLWVFSRSRGVFFGAQKSHIHLAPCNATSSSVAPEVTASNLQTLTVERHLERNLTVSSAGKAANPLWR